MKQGRLMKGQVPAKVEAFHPCLISRECQWVYTQFLGCLNQEDLPRDRFWQLAPALPSQLLPMALRTQSSCPTPCRHAREQQRWSPDPEWAGRGWQNQENLFLCREARACCAGAASGC